MHTKNNRLQLFALCGVCLVLCTACSSVDNQPGGSVEDPLEGVLTLPDGKKKYILPEEFAYTGEGSYTNPDGETLTGTFKNGLLQGFGHEQTRTESYTGQWLDGVRQGPGELTRPNFKYEGDFANNLPHGQGIQNWSGGRYQGSFADGKFSGQGVLHSNKGHTYQGFWKDGKREGFGQQANKDGSTYQGDWLNNLPDGFGVREYADSSFYEGHWQQGDRHGYGAFNNGANMTYEGLWEKDQRHGYGKQTQPDGSYFQGQWRLDKQHGTGLAANPDGGAHEGTWQEGYILGPGTRTHRSGITFSGNWTGNTVTNGMLVLPSGARYGGPLYKDRGRVVAEPLLNWLRERSTEHDPDAQYLLATALLDFSSPAPDPTTAAVWLEKAATSGHADAQYRLARMLQQQDISTALTWLQQAAAAAHPLACLQLAEFYHRGYHLQQDLQLAKQFYQLAISRGNILAANNLAWLLATTSDEQIADPQRAINLVQPYVIQNGDSNFLDTLAAAHARLGNMELAVRMQEQAVSKVAGADEASGAADQEMLVAEMQARLALYKAGEAYVE